MDTRTNISPGGIFNSEFASAFNFNIINPSNAVALNALTLHRQGPYGGSNWKLYKKDYHPIVRFQKNHNQIGYINRQKKE